MLHRIIFCLLLVLQPALMPGAMAQKMPVKYINAQDVIKMAKTSGKPYLWVALYIPKCANATELFSERTGYYHKKKDKLDLVMLTVLKSDDNMNILSRFSDTFNFPTPFYVIDTNYSKDNPRERHFEFMKDLHRQLGVKHQFFQHIIIDQKGRMIYRTEDNIDFEKADRLLK